MRSSRAMGDWSLKVIQTPEGRAREDEFVRTHVSKYVIPDKIRAARRRRAKTVSVPVADLERLLAKAGVET